LPRLQALAHHGELLLDAPAATPLLAEYFDVSVFTASHKHDRLSIPYGKGETVSGVSRDSFNLYPKPVDFRKPINGLAVLVELDIKVKVSNPVLLVFLNHSRSQVKTLYWERNSFFLWLKRLEAERFKTKPNAGDEDMEPKLQTPV